MSVRTAFGNPLWRWLPLAGVALVITLLLSPSDDVPGAHAAAATITVNSSLDVIATDSVLDLREAIRLATGVQLVGSLDSGECGQILNTTYSGGCVLGGDTIGSGSADTILFSGSMGITLSAPLPTLSTAGDTINGASAGITVDGVTQAFDCFLISGGSATGNTIKGLTIQLCTAGVRINAGATGNVIGGTSAADKNVISKNGGPGVDISGTGTTGNIVEGNYIGTNAAGTAAASNGGEGVLIAGGASTNTVGGSAAGARNVISGNGGNGVGIFGAAETGAECTNFTDDDNDAKVNDGCPAVGAAETPGAQCADAVDNDIDTFANDGCPTVGTTGTNTISGNYIGTNAAGTAAVGNSRGVLIDGGASTNTVGGTTPGERNIISANFGPGVNISGGGSSGNIVEGNYIGTAFDGTTALGNSGVGVEIDNADSNTVGGTIGTTPGGSCTGACNVIADSGYGFVPGVYICCVSTGGSLNQVLGNYIGTDVTGTLARPNQDGVAIQWGANNTIGGTTAAARNVISGNNTGGINLFNSGTTGNVIQGNFIGTNAAGSGPLPNTSNGIIIQFSAASNTIGGTAAGAGNVISSNTGNGVCLDSNAGTGNAIRRNAIYGNGLLGIDLVLSGQSCATGTATANDGPTDPDTGPNNLMNFPTMAVSTGIFNGVNTTITGTLDTPSPGSATVEVFSSATGDPEGHVFLGSTTAPGGVWTVTVSGAPPFPMLTATATDASGNTSEFTSPAYTPPLGAGLPLTQIAYQGQVTTWGTFGTFGPAQVPSTSGDVLFWASLGGPSQGIFRGNAGGITKLVRDGDIAPTGGTFMSFGIAPVMSASGDVAFYGTTTGGVLGIFKLSGVVITKIAAVGDFTPGGLTTYTGFLGPLGPSVPVINSLGDVAFLASISSGAQGIFLNTGSTAKVVVTGDPAPTGGTFTTFTGSLATVPVVTDARQVSFWAGVSVEGWEGVFLWDSGSTTKIAAGGDAAPGGGNYTTFGHVPSPNAAGQVAFWAAGTVSPSAVYVRSVSGTAKIFGIGDTGPAGVGGTISSIGSIPLMNGVGQVTVWTGIVNGLSAQSVVRYTGGALTNVAAVGNTNFNGGTFTSFVGGTGSVTVLNNLGQDAFWGAFDNGSPSQGIFITNATPAGATIITSGPIQGATVPGTNGGTFGPAFDLDINTHGGAVFHNSVIAGDTNSGIFMFFAGSPVRTEVRQGANGGITGGGSFTGFYSPVNNDNNYIAARATLSGTSPPSSEGLFMFFAGNPADPPAPATIVKQIHAGDLLPVGAGGGTVASFGNPAINDTSIVAATATLQSGGGQGLYMFFAGNPVKLRKTTETDGLTSTITGFGNPVINNNNTVAAKASLNTGEGLYLFFAGGPVKLAKTGEDDMNGGGMFTGFGDPVINNGDRVVATATTTGGKGLYMFFAGSPPVRLANLGTATNLVGGGSFQDFFSPAISRSVDPSDPTKVEVLARATLTGASVGEGLFMFFAGTAQKVVIPGDHPQDDTSLIFSGSPPAPAPPVFPYYAMSENLGVVFVANGVKGGVATQGVYFVTTDSDTDGVADLLDNCPQSSDPTQRNTDAALKLAGYNVTADAAGDACDADDDGDGVLDTAEPLACQQLPDCDHDTVGVRNDFQEIFMGTDFQTRCAADITANNEFGTDKWPFDFNDDRKAALADILAYIPVFNTTGNARWDQNQDGYVKLADILSYIPVFNLSCIPGP